MNQAIAWRLRSIIGIDLKYCRKWSQDKVRNQKEGEDWGCDSDDVWSKQPRVQSSRLKIVSGLSHFSVGLREIACFCWLSSKHLTDDQPVLYLSARLPLVKAEDDPTCANRYR